jgi:hypothetical protein
MGDIGKAFSFGTSLIKWWEGRPHRLRMQALEAAGHIIDILINGKYKGRRVSGKRRENVLKHELKRYNAWKDGV